MVTIILLWSVYGAECLSNNLASYLVSCTVLYLTRPSQDNTTEQLPQLKSFDVPASDRRGSDTSNQGNGLRGPGMLSVSYTVVMCTLFFHIE